MVKNSFTLRGSGEPRASTAVPVEQRPWNPPVRRIFSSREQVANLENVRQLEDYISRIDEPSSYLNDDSRLQRPFSNTRFGAVHNASTEVPDAETDEHASPSHSQDNLSGHPSLHENRTERSDSQEDQGSESQESTPVISSFSDVQDIIDSAWILKQIPEQFQEGFDRMKEEILNMTSELSKERRRCSSLSRDKRALQQKRSSLSQDVEALRQELDECREREKEMEIQVSKQDRALKAESSNVGRLQEENEKLKVQSRRDHEENVKTKSEMRQEIDALSKDLETAKRDIRYKDKFLGQIQRDVKNAKKEFDEEVKRREHAENELSAAKQECTELQARHREAKSQWKVLEEENEARMTKLVGINESLREKISVLEIAIEKQKETTQAVESDLVELVSFLRRISREVGRVFRAASIHGCLSVPVTTDFPASAVILEEQEKSFDIFGRLVEALDCASSLSVVLELASSYDDALKDFFRILVLRLVAQAEYICTKDEAFRQIESSHTLAQTEFQEQRRWLQEIRVSFSSQFDTMREEMGQSIEQICMKVRRIEEEKKRMKLELQTEKGKNTIMITMLGKFKERLFRERATLLDLKEKATAHYQELKGRISENATETSGCRGTLEEVKSSIERLYVACSMSGEKHKTAENTLKADMERLRIALAGKEEKIKELMERELDLQRAKNELSLHSRQAIPDEETKEKCTASLKEEKERLMTEKNEVASKLADAEHALQQMSGTIAEALSAKQEALEALILEKRLVEQLRYELSKVSVKGSAGPSNQGTPLKKGPRKAVSSHLCKEINKGTEGRPDGTQEIPVEQGKRSSSSLRTRRTSSAKVYRESPEADPSDVDFIPKKRKVRTSTPNLRKSPRRNKIRSDVPNPMTAEKCSELQYPNELLGSKESVQDPAEVHDAPSKSGAGRDEEWDIELVFGKGEG